MKAKVIAFVIAVLAVLALNIGTAQAASPEASVMHTSNSGILFQNDVSGQRTLYPGESTYGTSFKAFWQWTGPGWCTSRVDQTTNQQVTSSGGASGYWSKIPTLHPYLYYSWDC